MTQFKTSLTASALVVGASLLCPTTGHAAVLDLSSAPTDASSVNGGGFASSNAFDGNTATRWATAGPSGGENLGDNSWIWVDLGSDLTLQSVAIEWEAADATTYKLFALTSADAAGGIDPIGGGGNTAGDFSQWTEIASVSGAVDGSNRDTDTFDFVNQTVTLARTGGTTGTTSISLEPTARYLLINPISDDDINAVASIWEVSVTPVPEPGSLALLGLGGLLIASRRRRG